MSKLLLPVEAGDVYGRLKVLRMEHGRNRKMYAICVCECGTYCAIYKRSLYVGETRSCGCWNKECIAERSRTHGESVNRKQSKEYAIWNAMLARCRNVNNAKYPRYGGRGIKVCERWLMFENFLADMGRVPEGLSLDRINNDGNYEPDNCRWTTFKEQTRNSTTAKPITIDGVTKCLAEWVETTDIAYCTAKMRIRRGWDAWRALSEPVKRRAA